MVADVALPGAGTGAAAAAAADLGFDDDDGLVTGVTTLTELKDQRNRTASRRMIMGRNARKLRR
jgi:hypothetical protein